MSLEDQVLDLTNTTEALLQAVATRKAILDQASTDAALRADEAEASASAASTAATTAGASATASAVSAVTAGTSASTAVTHAAAASTSATTASSRAAEATAAAASASTVASVAAAARDAATVNANVYVDVATGLAAVADGVQFQVVSADGLTINRYLRVNAGSSTLVASYPSALALSAAAVSGDMTGATVVSSGASSVSILNAGSQSVCEQALSSGLISGQAVTLVYSATGTLGSGGYARTVLSAAGAGGASRSNTIDFVLDGSTQIVVLTATGVANLLFFTTASATVEVKYAVISGAPSAAATSPIASVLQGFLAATQPPLDSTMRNLGLLRSPLTSVSWAVTAPNPGEFYAEVTGSTSASQVIDQQPTGVKATFVYQVLDSSALNSLTVRFDQTGAGTPGPAVPLLWDGGIHRVTLDSGDSGANRLLFAATADSTFSIRYALFRGSLDQSSHETSIGQALVNLANMVTDAGAEAWSEPGKQILYPSTAFYVSGRRVSFYGRSMLRQRRRVGGLDLWLAAPATYNSGSPPLARHLIPDAVINASDIPGTSFDLVLRDPAIPAKVQAKTVAVQIASAAQTGTLMWCHLGDSLGDDMVQALYWRLLASGVAPVGYGTATRDVDDGAGTVNIKHESRASWSTSDYIGRTRPATNPFLKIADAADLLANPTLCFADDVSFGTGVRPSYAEDDTRATYSIFSWGHWRQNVAVALAGTEKLRVILNLGRNDGGATAITELGQSHIVADFLAAFANGTIFVGCESNGWNASGQYRWTRETEPLIRMKLRLFDGRTAERIYIIPGWAHMAGEVGYPFTVDSTDSETVSQVRTVTDDVHPVYLGYQQWAEAALGPMLYLHQTT